MPSYDDVDFRARLRTGFVALKHSRRGRPHDRFVAASEDFGELYWEPSAPARSNLRVLGRLVKRARRSRRCLALADVVAVRGDGRSAVLERARAKNFLATPFTVSLITRHGTSVDLEFPTAPVQKAMLLGFTKLIRAANAPAHDAAPAPLGVNSTI